MHVCVCERDMVDISSNKDRLYKEWGERKDKQTERGRDVLQNDICCE